MTLYFDDENQAYYWYDAETGLSRWDEPGDPHMDEEEKNSTSSEIREDVDSKLQLKKRKEHKKSKKKHEKLSQSNESPPAKESPELEQDLTSGGQTLICYSILFFINVLLLETPALISECIIRFGLLCLVLPIAILFLFFGLTSMSTLGFVLKELCISIACFLSLCIPGILCIAYWRFSTVKPFYVTYLPSLLGAVDIRRFVVPTVFGGASQARNSRIDGNLQDSFFPSVRVSSPVDFIEGILVHMWVTENYEGDEETDDFDVDASSSPLQEPAE